MEIVKDMNRGEIFEEDDSEIEGLKSVYLRRKGEEECESGDDDGNEGVVGSVVTEEEKSHGKVQQRLSRRIKKKKLIQNKKKKKSGKNQKKLEGEDENGNRFDGLKFVHEIPFWDTQNRKKVRLELNPKDIKVDLAALKH
uniref:Uncharacterized protein n=1 Tax=Timspurckia oligopyrenoides TaxID=708627 RepID=A0A7S1EUF3_9RHOD|mmetsp:Transcript_8256/g.14948  ORF Transcript_8256/g.14948 Transcript_8256/m.14948 type:complete len:140 (+) Transcript_8256:53-472(+)|eukprot:CAMPEP_0182448096 /NCGR_PEP_ID=MMETSP1172-20130603/23492_1 /TAXON_ID=708627 /ORGANISM="Timspurckia oligopyrenoides, Strain CCMP3278" /LENGTH=139 /DNA_ID=CAMNT_0024644821 /DNA_START=124 /DNA_END=543 /DNA_ORIENTATION=+